MKLPVSLTKVVTSVALAGSLALAGCSATTTSVSSTTSASSSSAATSTSSATSSSSTAAAASTISYDTHYDADDLTWDTSSEIAIDLANPTATDGVTVDNGTITITKAGNYRLTGTLADGQVVVNAGDEDVVRLILDNASITNKDGAALVSENANELIVYTAAGSSNSITDGSSYASTGEDDPDAGPLCPHRPHHCR
ncbi:MAG: carbohydrate-binding domain-containing protein [Rothia sp. (in: high G+C Gram-positive bacteria)]|nr:carbohydrate-binding domain-containing protein [Rothia sp. (in: high G+C Gram-positive bacteria)]